MCALSHTMRLRCRFIATAPQGLIGYRKTWGNCPLFRSVSIRYPVSFAPLQQPPLPPAPQTSSSLFNRLLGSTLTLLSHCRLRRSDSRTGETEYCHPRVCSLHTCSSSALALNFYSLSCRTTAFLKHLRSRTLSQSIFLHGMSHLTFLYAPYYPLA